MRSLGRRVGKKVAAVAAAGLAVGAVALVVEGPAARTSALGQQVERVTSAPAVSASKDVPFLYSVKNLPADSILHVQYLSGVGEASDGEARATAGGIYLVDFPDNAMTLSSTAGRSLDAEITEFLTVGTAPLQGKITVPPGTSVTMTDAFTNRSMALTDGSFSFPTS
jgi:hypothetical protein